MADPKPASATAPDLRRLAYSRGEAAEALGVSIDFFDRHIAHEVRVVRRGRRRLYPVRELQIWLEQSASLALGDR
jgi:hypothetical protein